MRQNFEFHTEYEGAGSVEQALIDLNDVVRACAKWKMNTPLGGLQALPDYPRIEVLCAALWLQKRDQNADVPWLCEGWLPSFARAQS